MMKKLLIVCVLSTVIAGCANTPRPAQQSAQPNRLVIHQDATQTQLAEAATSVSHSLAEMAALDSAVHPGVKLPPPPNPGALHMSQLASIDWVGPLQPIVQKIAKESHYRVKTLGNKPAVPIIISLSMENTPLADILRDVSYQAEKRAKIKVYPRQRVIEIRYLSQS